MEVERKRRLWDLPVSVVKYIVGSGCLEAAGRLATTSSTFRGLLDDPNPCFDRVRSFCTAITTDSITVLDYDHARSPPPACVAPRFVQDMKIHTPGRGFIHCPASRTRCMASVSHRCRKILALHVYRQEYRYNQAASDGESALASLVSASPHLESIVLTCPGQITQRFVWQCLAAPALQRIELVCGDIINQDGQTISLVSCVASAPIASCPALKQIFDTNFVDDESILTRAVAKCPRLSVLSFFYPRIAAVGIGGRHEIISSRPWLTLAAFSHTAILMPGYCVFDKNLLLAVGPSQSQYEYFRRFIVHQRYFDIRQLPIDLRNHLPGPEVPRDAWRKFIVRVE